MFRGCFSDSECLHWLGFYDNLGFLVYSTRLRHVNISALKTVHYSVVWGILELAWLPYNKTVHCALCLGPWQAGFRIQFISQSTSNEMDRSYLNQKAFSMHIQRDISPMAPHHLHGIARQKVSKHFGCVERKELYLKNLSWNHSWHRADKSWNFNWKGYAHFPFGTFVLQLIKILFQLPSQW